MKTTPRTAYNPHTGEKYPNKIEIPTSDAVRQAIPELDWPSEGMRPKDATEKLVEEWELSENQKTAVNKKGYNVFCHNVVGPLFRKLLEEDVLEQPRGKGTPYFRVESLPPERKQVLTQLLQDALANLEIRNSENQILPKEDYRERLLQYWSSYASYQSIDSLEILEGFGPHITSETTQSELLDFIRKEFKEAIHEDYIQSASCLALESVDPRGYPLFSLLKQLLNIAIGRGVKSAVSAFERCAAGREPASFQYIILLAGIDVDAKREVFDGIRIEPISTSIFDLLQYQSQIMYSGMLNYFLGSQLIIDASVSPIFHKPSPRSYKPGTRDPFYAFRSEIKNRVFQSANFLDFGETFCQALSLVVDSAVQPYLTWRLMKRDELFNLGGTDGGKIYDFTKSSKISMHAGELEIAKAAQLCEILANPSTRIGENLKIPIERWIKSQTEQSAIDKVIDLGIAFEALYLQGISGQLALQLRAAWHLGENKQDRKKLVGDFKEIYELRCQAVHKGRFSKSMPIKKAEGLIQRAQELCRKAILKILEDRIFPTGNDLILGE